MITSFRLSVIVFFCGIFGGCSETTCSNQVVSETSSPDHKEVARLVRRDCGATTDWVYGVVIRDSHSSTQADSIADFVFTIRGEHKIGMRWASANRLIITRPQLKQDVFKELKTWNGIEIVYQNEVAEEEPRRKEL